jgi:hypothetical protein
MNKRFIRGCLILTGWFVVSEGPEPPVKGKYYATLIKFVTGFSLMNMYLFYGLLLLYVCCHVKAWGI